MEARITTWSTPAALNIPSSAVVEVSGADQVFVVRDSRARAVPVQVGQRCGASVEILRGLQQGDRVILFPSDRVVDGTRVRIRAR